VSNDAEGEGEREDSPPPGVLRLMACEDFSLRALSHEGSTRGGDSFHSRRLLDQ
jgi:hypothetical protein